MSQHGSVPYNLNGVIGVVSKSLQLLSVEKTNV